MQTEKINDIIEVIAHFDGRTVKPIRIKWNDRPYKVKKLLFRWDSNEGKYKVWRFRVSVDSGDIFEITFDTESLKWKLETVQMDG